MSLRVQKSAPRVRFSIFLRCAAIVAIASALVATTIVISSLRQSTDLALDGLRAKAEALVQSKAAPAGGAIRYGRSEAIGADLDRLIESEGGAATAALVADAEGRILLERGPEASALAAELAALSVAAMSSGQATSAQDGLLVAHPVPFGEEGTIVGAVAVAWSPEPLMASITRAKLRMLGLSAVIFVIAMAGGIVYVKYTVARPLRSVGRAMKTVVGGGYDIEIPQTDRRDEIGLIARDLEYFRGMMSDASEATRAALFQSAAFRSSSAPMVLADADMRITHTNAAYDGLARDNESEFRKLFPDFAADHLVGQSVDIFHKDANRNRRMVMNRGALPMSTDIHVGRLILQLRINGIEGDGGAIAGYVVEWSDVTVQRRDAAVLRGLEARQIGIQFDRDQTFDTGNAQLVALVGEGGLP